MSDTAINKVIQYGTNADMMAFTPAPASGSQILYLWEDTDSPGDLYMWDGSSWVLVTGSGSAINQLTGDVTAGPGGGSQAATIANDAVTNAKAANMAADTIKGRAHGAGTGDPTDLTANQVSTILDTATDPFVRTSAVTAPYTDEKAQDAIGAMIDSSLVYTDATPLLALATKHKTRQIKFVIGDGVNVLSTGVQKGTDQTCPVTGTITGVRVLADVSGSLVLDLWKDTYANYPPTVADTITASAKPTLSSATKYEDTTLTGWTTSVTAGDTFRVNVDSVSTITTATIELTIVTT